MIVIYQVTNIHIFYSLLLPFALEEDVVSPLSMYGTLLPSAPPPFLALDQKLIDILGQVPYRLKLYRTFLCIRDMIYMRTNNSFQTDSHYRCMIEKFLAHNHIDHFYLNSPAWLGWAGLAGLAGIERGGLGERKDGEREEDDSWNFYQRISRLDWCKRNGYSYVSSGRFRFDNFSEKK